jgi:hypothetical protein
MRAFVKRLRHLEARSARFDPSKRQHLMEDLPGTAEDYIHSARQYLGEATERSPVSCQTETEMIDVVNRMLRYHISSLRHSARERHRRAAEVQSEAHPHTSSSLPDLTGLS